MKVYDRLKMELSNRQYLTEEQYIQFLIENNLQPEVEYDKETMQRDLLYTVIDILDAIKNDTDSMKSITTEFETIGRAYEYLDRRTQEIKNKIASLPSDEDTENCFSLMFTRGGTKTKGRYIRPIPKNTINNLR